MKIHANRHPWLGHLGLSPQRLPHKSCQQDPEKVRVYLTGTYPDVVAQAKHHRPRWYFVDEASFRSDVRRGITRGKIGETPVVRDGGGRFGLKLNQCRFRARPSACCGHGQTNGGGLIQQDWPFWVVSWVAPMFWPKLHKDHGPRRQPAWSHRRNPG